MNYWVVLTLLRNIVNLKDKSRCQSNYSSNS